MSSYPPSTLAYPHLNQLLDSLLPISVSSTSSTFTLSSIADSSPLPVASLDSSTPPAQLPPISYLLTTTASMTLPVLSSSLQSPVPMKVPMTDPPSLSIPNMQSPLRPIFNNILPSVN